MRKVKKIIIAIDGYSSTGKSTLAKKLAKKLGYIYVDTGAMYRSVTLYAMQNNLIGKDYLKLNEFISNLDNLDVSFKYNPSLGFSEVYLNGINVEGEIRNIDISNNVSKIAALSDVRKKMVEQQKRMGSNKGIVMDGRDIGTVVFPEAELKFFMTASAEKRAQRRYMEMINKGEQVSYKSVLDNVNSRDFLDTTRKDSPLVKADDAVEIDNSDLSVEETFTKVYNYIISKNL